MVWRITAGLRRENYSGHDSIEGVRRRTTVMGIRLNTTEVGFIWKATMVGSEGERQWWILKPITVVVGFNPTIKVVPRRTVAGFWWRTTVVGFR